MPKIFLSYSRKDITFRDRLLKDLTAEGIEVWIDDQGLKPGDPSWRIVIEQAIERAVCTVVLLSPNAKSSVEVRKEISYSEVQEKIVIPVLIAGSMKTAAPSNLIESQFVDLRTQYEQNLQKLTKVLKDLISGSSGAKKSYWPSAKWVINSWDETAADEPKQETSSERSHLRGKIISLLSTFYLNDRSYGSATIGSINVVIVKDIGITLSVMLPNDLLPDRRQKIVSELDRRKFMEPRQDFVGVFAQPNQYKKLYKESGANIVGEELNLQIVADELIDVNLILGLRLDNLELEADF